MRTATSPRLATRTVSNMLRWFLDRAQQLVELDNVLVLGVDTDDRAGDAGEDLVHHLHASTIASG
jgi:hypothetical protein